MPTLYFVLYALFFILRALCFKKVVTKKASISHEALAFFMQ
jgi:hypothetical protein